MLLGASRPARDRGPDRRGQTRNFLRTTDGRQYLLEKRLASGPHHAVWLALSASGERRILKGLTMRASQLPHAQRWIRHEALMLESARHASVVELIDRVSSDEIEAHGLPPSSPVLVLEHLGGGDLTSLAGLPALHWARPVLELIAALEHLHSQRIVHGDVKARNVMFDSRDRARLIDFSCAARIGDVFMRPFGTPEHRRPGVTPHVVSVDDDIFALAVLIHELVTGRLPRDGRAYAETVNYGAAENVLMKVVFAALDAQSNGAHAGLSEIRDAVHQLTD
jgi:serine/threonine protein kinase